MTSVWTCRVRDTWRAQVDLYGEINTPPPEKTHKEVQIWIQEIHGVNYYIDNQNNVYNYNDIINNKTDPRIIAYYLKTNDTYSIPELNNGPAN